MEIILAISKETGEEIIGRLVGEIQEDLNYICMQDIFKIQWVNNQNGQILPVPVDYPSPSLESLLTIKAYENFVRYFSILKDKYWYFKEEDIKEEVVKWYNTAIASKTGITMANDIPQSTIIT